MGDGHQWHSRSHDGSLVSVNPSNSAVCTKGCTRTLATPRVCILRSMHEVYHTTAEDKIACVTKMYNSYKNCDDTFVHGRCGLVAKSKCLYLVQSNLYLSTVHCCCSIRVFCRREAQIAHHTHLVESLSSRLVMPRATQPLQGRC